MERKLVTLRRIDALQPIDGADLIELAIIGGWQLIVKKGEFNVGDFCVYHEIDSFCPIHPRYEFLRKGCYKRVDGLGEGFRIKTIKLRGNISQGLALPLSAFDIYQESETTWKYTAEGFTNYLSLDEDLSYYFGVIKYDKPLPPNLVGKARGNFPSDIPKTDQERVQNLMGKLQVDGSLFEVSLKLDGSSMTVYKRAEDDYGVCSRNLELKIEGNEGNSFVQLCLDTNLWDSIPTGLALQGELMGPGIQGNREGFTETKYFIYDIYDINNKRYLTPTERSYICSYIFYGISDRIQHIPLVLPDMIYLEEPIIIDRLLEFADIKSINHPIAEGVVFKREDGQFSFKIINNRFLLKEE